MRQIVIGTRGSRLALKQTEMVESEIRQKLSDCISDIDVQIIKTRGDRFLDMSLTSQLEKGLFTREIEDALLNKSIDMAIHSLKDLPIECAPGTTVGAYLSRAQTPDVVIGTKTLDELPDGAIVGTSSKRRSYQLRIHYPHLNFREIRGNVETRIAKLDAGAYDAIIMAQAGIDRLGLENRVVQIIPENIVVPAPGQAAIAIHVRADDKELLEILQRINDAQTQFEVEWERNLLQSLGGGCAIPLGCVCHKKGVENQLLAFYSTENGDQYTYIDTTFADSESDAVLQKTKDQFEQIKSL